MLTITLLKNFYFISLSTELKKEILEITIVGTGLLIGLILSWVLGLTGGDAFVWIFFLYLGLEFGKTIFSDDNNDDDDDFDGGILSPAYNAI